LPSEGLVNVPLERFMSLSRWIKAGAAVVPLAELLEEHRAGRSTGGAVALTFDDAYASLLDSLPFFRAERLPLTIFVTTEAAARGGRFWWDRTDDLFSRVSAERWATFEREIGVPVEYHEGQPAEFGPLRPLRQWILAAFKGRWPAELESALTALESEVQFQTSQRSMTFAELATMSREPLVDFGVHTVSHPVLPLLDPAEFHVEVAGAHEILKRELPRVQPILAIPFGLFDQFTASRAVESGMSASLTLAGRTLENVAPQQGLPRFCLTTREPGYKLWLRITGAAEKLLGQRMEGGMAYPALPSPTS
jgi:peptidoglycan/xylan/chitin deacetylase (PgdA/CDA1 family)